jgi:Glycosyl transferase family 2
MRLIGLMHVRNEDWILGLSLRVALLWCDSVVVYLHACTDGSAGIIEDVIRENERGRLTVLHESDPKWDEMRHRQEALEAARRDGATHIAIIDADEVLTGNWIPSGGVGTWRLGQDMPAECMLQLPLYNLRGGMTRYHSNGLWGNRIVDVAFRDDPRLRWSGDCFHSRAPRAVSLQPYLQPYRPIEQGQGGILHLWGVSERRLRAKHALYKLTERLRWPDKPVCVVDQMYSWAVAGDPNNRQWGTPDTWTYADVPDSWLAEYRRRGWLEHVHLDADPWQEAECRRIVAANPGIEAGLDLFGVV